MKFEDKYFQKLRFTKEQIKQNFNNALKDLNISKQDKILEVKFNYAYSALIKGGIALISFYERKLKSQSGHHVKLIEKMSQILGDDSINAIGNLMRSKRNMDLYAGGVEVTEKECKEYFEFVDGVLKKIKEIVL